MVRRKTSKSNFNWAFFYILLFAVLALGFLIIYMSITRPFCANSISCMNGLTGNFDPTAKNAEFLGQNIKSPKLIADKPVATKVLGEVSTANKRIEVDLTHQMLYAFQNGQVVMSFPISSGKWNKTPTGTFHIWIKLRYTRMSGGTGADYYNLPNVPYVMFFYNDQVGKGRGFSLHGAYWHNNFGYPMSHGCVNISPVNAGKLYDWANPVVDGNMTYASDANPGTEVVIY